MSHYNISCDIILTVSAVELLTTLEHILVTVQTDQRPRNNIITFHSLCIMGPQQPS